MWSLVMGITLMFSGQERGRWDPCSCVGREFPGVAHRSAFLNTLREEYRDSYYFATGDLMAGKSDLESIRAALDILQAEGPLFFAIGERDMETSPEIWESAFTGSVKKGEKKGAGAESGSPPESWAPPSFPAVLTNANLPWTRRYYETRIEGKKFIFLNFVDPLKVGLEWNLTPVDWAMNDLETLLGLWQVYPEDIYTVVVLHMEAGDAIATARAFAKRWNLVIVAHDSRSGSQSLDLRSIAIGSSPCGDVSVFQWDILNFPGRFVHKIYYIDERTVTTPDEKILANLARLAAKEQEIKGQKKPETTGLIVGTGACENCHKPEVAHWRKTSHGKRFEGNVQACGSCHAPLAAMGERTVGCEACHTGGSRHIFSHTTLKLGRKAEVVKMPPVDRNVCSTCHKPDGKHIKDFRMEEYWKQILHPAPAKEEEKGTVRGEKPQPEGETKPS